MSEPTEPLDLDAIEARANEATEGPWIAAPCVETTWRLRAEKAEALSADRFVLVQSLERRIENQRHQLRTLQADYEKKVEDLGIFQWAKRCAERYRMVREHAQTLAEQRNAALAELEAEVERADALIAALPKCDHHPERPATNAYRRGGGRWCDECRPRNRTITKESPYDPSKDGVIEAPDYPRAQAIRAILAARAKVRP